MAKLTGSRSTQTVPETHSRVSKQTEVLSGGDEKGEGSSSQEGPMFRKRRGENLKSYLERIDVEANSRIMEAYRKSRKPSERRKRYRSPYIHSGRDC